MKLDMPSVSVIIPVYNSQNYLCETMDCIVGQSLKNIEIICVNDGSSDSSLEILEEYKKKDDRIIIISQPNMGAGPARNAGMQIAKGEFLSFLDADDHFELDMLEIAYKNCILSDADIAVFKCDLFDDGDGTIAPCPWGMHTELLPPQMPFSWRDVPEDIFRVFNGWAWDKLFRASFVKENKLLFQNLKTTNDMFFVMSALIKAERIIVIDQVLAHQRRNLQTSLSKNREASWGCFYEALTALQSEIRSMGIYTELERGFVNLALQHSLWQLNTITGQAFESLYNKLKGSWFEKLGVSGRESAYFFNPGWYRQYERIMYYDSEEFWNIQRCQDIEKGLTKKRSCFIRRLLQRIRFYIRM